MDEEGAAWIITVDDNNREIDEYFLRTWFPGENRPRAGTVMALDPETQMIVVKMCCNQQWRALDVRLHDADHRQSRTAFATRWDEDANTDIIVSESVTVTPNQRVPFQAHGVASVGEPLDSPAYMGAPVFDLQGGLTGIVHTPATQGRVSIGPGGDDFDGGIFVDGPRVQRFIAQVEQGQHLVSIPDPAIKPPPDYIKLIASEDTSPPDLSLIHQGITALVNFAEHIQLPVPREEFRIYVHHDPVQLATFEATETGGGLEDTIRDWQTGNVGANGLWGASAGNALFVRTEPPLSDGTWQFTPGVRGTVIHELVHSLYQYGIAGYVCRLINTENHTTQDVAWFSEGMANLFEELAIAHARGDAYSNRYLHEWTLQADKPLRFYENLPETSTGLFGHAYALGELAVGYLASKVGLRSVVNYYTQWIPGDTWQLAFLRAYGMTIEEFYDEFAEHYSNGAPQADLLANTTLPEIHEADRQALTDVYNARLPNYWPCPDSWNTDAPLGDWWGVSTDIEGRVTGLSLSTLYISHIPPSMGNLSSLRTLDLSSNLLSGQIPDEIGRLTNLIRLDMSNIDELTGTIPASLGNLQRLRTLDLSNNFISGPIPPEIGNLHAVTSIDLSSNRLTGSIPSTFDKLTGLARLNLSSNELTGTIPASIGNLQQLRTLDLSLNMISGSIPPEIGNLRAITSLSLQWNQLHGSIPPEIGKSTKLTGLDLSGNSLVGPIPSTIWDLTELINLNLSFNALTGTIQPEIANLLELRSVDLSQNELSGSIPSEIGDLQNLGKLILAGNDLTGGCFPASLAQVPDNDLDSVYISQCVSEHHSGDKQVLEQLYHTTGGQNWTNSANWMSDEPISEWHGIKTDATGRVSHIDLYKNNLTGRLPVALFRLENLEVLKLVANHLEGPIPSGIGALVNLREVNLSTNMLSGPIPAEIGDLSRLESLRLFNNQLQGPLPTEFGRLSRLTVLDISWNPLGGPVPPVIRNLTSLHHLFLGDSQLIGEIPLWFEELTELKTIWLSDNQLMGGIPAALGNMYGIRSLRLGNNLLTGQIPKEIANLKRYLSILDLSGNRLTGTIPDWFGSMWDLSILYLSGNAIEGCIPKALMSASDHDLDDIELPTCP